jgi:hypothetical protein
VIIFTEPSSSFLYSILLQKEDKFYFSQLLHDSSTYYIHTRTGSIGQKGRITCRKYTKIETAIKEFEKRFYQKTNNDWASFMEHLFEPTEGYYHPIMDVEEFQDTQEAEEEPNIFEQNIELYHIYDPFFQNSKYTEEEKDNKEEIVGDAFIKAEFPPEVFAIIFEFCNIDTLCKLQLACKHFKNIIDNIDDILERLYQIFDSLYDTPNATIDDNWNYFRADSIDLPYFSFRKRDLEEYNQYIRRKAFIEYKKREIMRENGNTELPDEATVSSLLPKNATLSFKQIFDARLNMVRYLNQMLKTLRVELDYHATVTMIDALKVLTTCSESFEGLRLGAWKAKMQMGHNMQEVIDFMLQNQDQITKHDPNLQAIHLADIDPDRWENSWIEIGDVGQLLATWKSLLHFKCNGSCISFGTTRLVHHNLMSITIISSGIPISVIKSILDADLPNLYHLELLLGIDYRGGNFSVEDFDILLRPEETGIFPSLQYLGLRNNYDADSFCKAIALSAIIRRIRILDLSNGALEDEGAKELLKIEDDQVPLLEYMDLHHNFMSNEVAQ